MSLPVAILVLDLLICICIVFAGLSFTEAERRLKENGPNVPLEYTFPSWWYLLWHAFFHPFNIILIILSALSYIASDSPNGCIMLVLVFISVSLRFYQVFSALLICSLLYNHHISANSQHFLNAHFRNTLVLKLP